MQILFGRHVGWFQAAGNTSLEYIKVLKAGSDVALTVELETPFLFVVPLVQGEWNETMGENEKEGEERRKAVRHAGKTLESQPRELMVEGGRF